MHGLVTRFARTTLITRPARISRITRIAVLAAATLTAAAPGMARLQWQWSYSTTGVDASGLFDTNDVADAKGYYQITAISGQRNGDAIIGLYPTGSAIPGNGNFAVDNLMRVNAGGQITKAGFGYALQGDAYANPFYATFLNPKVYFEVYTQGSTYAEQRVAFSATPIPEPSSLALLALVATAATAVTVVRNRRSRAGAPH